MDSELATRRPPTSRCNVARFTSGVIPAEQSVRLLAYDQVLTVRLGWIALRLEVVAGELPHGAFLLAVLTGIHRGVGRRLEPARHPFQAALLSLLPICRKSQHPDRQRRAFRHGQLQACINNVGCDCI